MLKLKTNKENTAAFPVICTTSFSSHIYSVHDQFSDEIAYFVVSVPIHILGLTVVTQHCFLLP